MTDLVLYQNYKEIVSYGRSPEVMETFSRLVGRNAPHYVQSAIIAVQANDRLMQCTPKSIFRSALRAATLRLSCDPALGHAWLVPYKTKNGGLEAQFQAGWKGIQHMALRTGKYRYINVSPVYEGEEVVEDRITGSLRIEGEITTPKKEKGLIASFALLSGLQKSIYMTHEELEAHGRKYSKGYSKPDGIWTTNKPAAYHKTILLKLLRTYGYLDPSDAAILSDDDDPEYISDLELPEEAEVTIIEHTPIPAEKVNKLLGFDDDEPEDEPVPEDEPKPAPVSFDETMTIEDAYKFETSKGVQYGKMTIDGLEKMLSAMWSEINNNELDDAEKTIIRTKIEAAQMVHSAKVNKEI